MDRVRFGRALGYGTRHAAKALIQAANAAAAPGTSQRDTVPRQGATTAARVNNGSTRVRATPTGATAANAKRVASRSFLHPVKRYSGTVLLQVVGTFFAVFALLMAQTAWKLRAGFHQPFASPDALHLWLSILLFAVFGWFALSSFLRAGRLERS